MSALSRTRLDSNRTANVTGKDRVYVLHPSTNQPPADRPHPSASARLRLQSPAGAPALRYTPTKRRGAQGERAVRRRPHPRPDSTISLTYE